MEAVTRVGQAGEQPPIDARIVHVADAYDAMTTDRSYRGRTHEVAIAILREYAGIQFDPKIVEVFASLPIYAQEEDLQTIEDEPEHVTDSHFTFAPSASQPQLRPVIRWEVWEAI
jgi:HD-GYP domain-containing protein (c-di-GMP phosphodiesterase class II)